MDDVPHIKLIRDVIIVSNDNAVKVIQFLNQFSAEYYVRDAILLAEDEAILSGKDI